MRRERFASVEQEVAQKNKIAKNPGYVRNNIFKIKYGRIIKSVILVYICVSVEYQNARDVTLGFDDSHMMFRVRKTDGTACKRLDPAHKHIECESP